MATFDKHQLEYIRGTTVHLDTIKSLTEERDKAFDTLNRQQSKTYTKHELSPRPQNDVYIPKTYSTQGLDADSYDKKYQELKAQYDDKRFNAAKEHYQENHPSSDVKMLDDLGMDDFSVLLEEDGVEKLHAIQMEREAMEKEETLEALNIQMDEKEAEMVFGDLDQNMYIESVDEKDIIQDQNIEADLQMDEATGDKFFSNYQKDLNDFKDNAKDMDIDKAPAPTDDFE